jgi:hypothetical protein
MVAKNRSKVGTMAGMVGGALLLFCMAVVGLDAVETELIEAFEAGQIDVLVLGSESLDQLVVEIRNVDQIPLRVVLVPGTIFSTGDPGFQRMGVVEEVIVTAAPGECKQVVVPVACLDMDLRQPESGMVFRGAIGFQGPGGITRLVTTPEFQEASFRIQQFAIWTLIATPGSREEYAGIGLGPEIVEALAEQGLPEEIIAGLYYLPDLVYALTDEEIEMLERLFDNAGVPVQGADEFYILLATGRPTMQELAYVGRMFAHAGIPLQGIAAVPARQ